MNKYQSYAFNYSYYSTGPKLINWARECLQRMDKENAMICLIRYCHRFQTAIKDHPEYNGLPIEIKTHLPVVLKKVQELREELLLQFKNEFLQKQLHNLSIELYISKLITQLDRQCR